MELADLTINGDPEDDAVQDAIDSSVNKLESAKASLVDNQVSIQTVVNDINEVKDVIRVPPVVVTEVEPIEDIVRERIVHYIEDD